MVLQKIRFIVSLSSHGRVGSSCELPQRTRFKYKRNNKICLIPTKLDFREFQDILNAKGLGSGAEPEPEPARLLYVEWSRSQNLEPEPKFKGGSSSGSMSKKGKKMKNTRNAFLHLEPAPETKPGAGAN